MDDRPALTFPAEVSSGRLVLVVVLGVAMTHSASPGDPVDRVGAVASDVECLAQVLLVVLAELEAAGRGGPGLAGCVDLAQRIAQRAG